MENSAEFWAYMQICLHMVFFVMGLVIGYAKGSSDDNRKGD